MVYNIRYMSQNMLQKTPDMTVDQPNGAVWPVFYDFSTPGDLVVLTGAGQELYGDPERWERTSRLIHRYKIAEMGDTALQGSDPEIRQKLGQGQQATVYSMGPYAVREEAATKGDWAAIGELEGMALINELIEHGMPRWLHVPLHYAIHVDPLAQKTYTLMDKIDSGLTLEDIINYPEVPEERKTLVASELGDEVGAAQAVVPDLFDRAHDFLAEAIEANGKDTEEVLNDWEPRNVLVERLPYPIAGENYSLHVIDQHKR